MDGRRPEPKRRLYHPGVGYSARIRIRYNECDVQGVVFNANYLIYVDETLERWISDVLGPGELDMMVKKATVEWHSSATHGEILELAPVVSRWGNTSYDLTVTGSVGDRAVFTATMVYINVIPGTKTPAPVPEHIKTALNQSTVD
jgi:acyl-CoA thioester hydrolase